MLTLLAGLLLAALVPGGPAPPGHAWVPPLEGRVVVLRSFAPPPPERPWERGHRGVDLVVPVGGLVRSAGRGTVTFAGPLAGRGVVVVAHGRLRTTYEPVRARVVVGDHVEAGDPLGSLEARAAGLSPHPGLHWGLLRGRTYLDPLILLRRTERIRLLPFLAGASAPRSAPASGSARGP